MIVGIRADAVCGYCYKNIIVYGINYSEQIDDSILSGNNGKGSTIKLTDEINETERMLGCINNSQSKEIKERYLQEIPPKEDCRIM